MRVHLSLFLVPLLVSALAAQGPGKEARPDARPDAKQEAKAQAPKSDRVVLSNGDTLHGKFQKLEDGVVHFESPALGTIKIQLGKIRKLETAKPVILVTKKGKEVQERLTDLQDGQLVFADGQRVERTEVQFAGPERKKPVSWKGSLAVGGVYELGNTEKRKATVQADFERRSKLTRWTGNFFYIYEEERIDRNWDLTDREIRGRSQLDYFLTERSYVFVTSGAERDTLADLDLRGTVGVGYGYQFYDTDTFKLLGEFGANYVREEVDDPSDTDDYVASRVRAKTEWGISKDLKFLGDISYFQGYEDTDDINVFADARLRFQFTSNMFGQLQYIFDYDNTPGGSAKRYDHDFLLSVGLSF